MIAALNFILSPIGKIVAGIVLAMSFLGGVYLKGYSDGKAKVQAEWNAAELNAIERGAKARRDADRDVAADPDGVSDDRFRRD